MNNISHSGNHYGNKETIFTVSMSHSNPTIYFKTWLSAKLSPTYILDNDGGAIHAWNIIQQIKN